MIFTERKEVTLLNGIVLKSNDGDFPPLQDIADIEYACEICPVRPLCQDNNQFDCQIYGMFSGFYIGIDGALDFFENNKIVSKEEGKRNDYCMYKTGTSDNGNISQRKKDT